MSKLRPKNLSDQDDSGASFLPKFMQSLKHSDTISLSIDKLVSASKDWNFYKPLSIDKMEELMLSIENNGLIHPILVWQRDKNLEIYTILSGHNRTEAYKKLYEATLDEKYKFILSQIKTDISDDKAKELIIDSNWVQRTLSTSERTKSIYEKYILLEKNKENNGYMKIYDTIADDFNLSGKQIRRYIKLNSLIPPFLELLDTQNISLRAGIRLANFESNTQQSIFELMGKEKIVNKNIEGLKKDMTFKEIEDKLLQNENESINVNILVPKKIKDDFLNMANKWLEKNKF